MIIKKLLDFKYYYDKLPLYLRNSESFPEHFRIWCEFLNGLDTTSDKLLGMVDIFDSKYITKYGDICDDYLNKLGKLYGVTRTFSVVVKENGVDTIKPLSLTQSEFILLIKSQIIKNFYQGTNEELEKFYAEANLPIVMKTSTIATCDYTLFLGVVNGIDSSATNIINMFKSGLLTIQSAGILYTYDVYDSSRILMWDTSDRTWGELNGGEWTT